MIQKKGKRNRQRENETERDKESEKWKGQRNRQRNRRIDRERDQERDRDAMTVFLTSYLLEFFLRRCAYMAPRGTSFDLFLTLLIVASRVFEWMTYLYQKLIHINAKANCLTSETVLFLFFTNCSPFFFTLKCSF